MDIHPSNNLHTCKIDHGVDSGNEIFKFKITLIGNLHARLIPVKQNRHNGYSSKDLYTCKIEHGDDSENVIFHIITLIGNLHARLIPDNGYPFK